MLAARFKQCALMPLAASPLLSALVGGLDLVYLGAYKKLLKFFEVCRNVIHVMWLQDHEARLANLTLEQPLSSRHQQLPTSTPHTYHYK